MSKCMATLPPTTLVSFLLTCLRSAKGRPHYYSTKREEYAHVTFDLTTDLTSLFNWNTKQLFVWISATYPSSSPATIPDSESVIWDAIIPASNAPWHQNTYIHPAKNRPSKKSKLGKPYPPGGSPGIIRLEGQKPKYQITDISGKMAERENATLTLHWNVQPWVGLLTWTNTQTYGRWEGLKGGKSKLFTFPALKGSETIKKDELKTETGGERNRGSPA